MGYELQFGWQSQEHGSELKIDLRGKYVKSATIRFSGVERIRTDTEYSQQDSRSRGSGSAGQRVTGTTSPASVPDGWDFRDVIGGSEVSPEETPAEMEAAVRVHGRGWSRESRTSYFDTNVTQNVPSVATEDTQHEAYCSEDFSYSFVTRTRFRRTTETVLESRNPRVDIDGTVTQHYGTLGDGQRSSTLNLQGLADDSKNTLKFAVQGSGRCGVLIEIEYATMPEIGTLPARDIGPDRAIMEAELLTAGNMKTDVYLRYGIKGEFDPAFDSEDVQETWGDVETGDRLTYSVSGLEVNQQYEFQFYAESDIGMDKGGVEGFETDALPPGVETLEPQDIAYFEATLKGELTATGGLMATVFIEYGETGSYELGPVEIGSTEQLGTFSTHVDGLKHDTRYYYRAYAENAEGRTNGDQRTFTTPYPYLVAPEQLTPEHGHRTESLRPVFAFVLPEKEENPAEKYHARIRFSASVGMRPLYRELESSEDTSSWEMFDSENEKWVAFPAEGVAPGTRVKVTPDEDLPFGPVYWDCASFDGDRYGFDRQRRIDLYIPFEGLYGIYIGSPEDPHVQEEWKVIDRLNVVEASNGEIGSVDFNVYNELEKRVVNLLPRDLSHIGETWEEAVQWDIQCDLTRVDEQPRKGQHCLRVDPAHETSYSQLEFHDTVPELGKYYTWSFYIKAHEPGVWFGIELGQSASIISGTFTSRQYVAGDDLWHRVSITHYFRDTEEGSPYVARMLIMASNDTYWLEGLQLEEGRSMTPWKLGGREAEVVARDIEYGAPVILACRDVHGNIEEFQGYVREKTPAGPLMDVTAVMSDGFMAERVIKEDPKTPMLLDFDGENYVYVDGNDDFRVRKYQSLYISADIACSDIEGDLKYILCCGSADPLYVNYALRRAANNKLQFWYTSRDNEVYETDFEFEENVIHRIELTMVLGVPEIIKIKVDGVVQTGAWIHGDGSGVPYSQTDLYIGCRNPEQGYYWDGEIANVSVVKKTDPDNPLGSWHIDEGEGVEIKNHARPEFPGVADKALWSPTEHPEFFEDIGQVVRHMVETYCPPIKATGHVNTQTGFGIPLKTKDKTVLQLMEEVRRNFGLFYFVDRMNELHLFKPEEVETPEEAYVLVRGELEEE